MKNLIRGVVVGCAVTLSLSAATRTVSCGSGPVKFIFRASAVFTKRDVSVSSQAEIGCKTGILYNATEGDRQVFNGGWNTVTAPPINDGDLARLLAADYVGFERQVRRRELYHTLAWNTWPVYNAGRLRWEEAPFAVDTARQRERVMYQVLTVDTYYSSLRERAYHGEHKNTFDDFVFGLRVDVGFLYSFLKQWGVFMTVGWKLEMDRKKDKGEISDVSFSVDKKMEEFQGLGEKDKFDITKKIFAHSQGMLATGVKVTAKIKETLSVMAGVCWSPVEKLSFMFSGGVRRYVLEATYSGGVATIPGTASSYASGYTRKSGKSQWLVSPDKEVKLTGTAWPVAFSFMVGYNIYQMHNFFVGVEYATFSKELKGDVQGAKAEDAEQAYGACALKNPLLETPTAAQVADPMNIHQSAATDVELRYRTKIDVTDVGGVIGYTIAL